MSQLVIAEAGPEPDAERAQWFTPPLLAGALVQLATDALVCFESRRQDTMRILEPSAGRGALVRSVLHLAPDRAVIHAVEIDERWLPDLRGIDDSRVVVDHSDYLERPTPTARYDLAITNPPYDGGEEVEHLAKLLDECDRIVALLPARSLHGRDRYSRVWKRFDRRAGRPEWHVRHVRHCIARPRFGEKGGTDEIVLLDLRRHDHGPCEVSWC